MRTFVKVGGALLDSAAGRQRLARSIASALGRDPAPELAIVHGGGKQIASLANKLGIVEQRVEGLRVTGADTALVVMQVLAGEVNAFLVAALLAEDVPALGLHGASLGLFAARRKTHPEHDLGYVGTLAPEDVSSEALECILSMPSPSDASPRPHRRIIPVIATVGPERGASADAPFLNVNADEAAGPLAAAASADELLFLSDVPGVLDAKGDCVKELDRAACETAIQDGSISGGMIPKVRAALHAVDSGVKSVRILSGDCEDPLQAAAQGLGTEFHA